MGQWIDTRCKRNERRLETYSLSQSSKSLLLGVGVDISADEEGNGVEEWNPGMLREEFLSKGQGERGGDPANFHDGPEAGTDGGTDLMPRSSAGDHSHGCQIDRVLDGSNLGRRVSEVTGEKENMTRRRTTRLLVMI